jgi:hypothetical protein
VKAVREKIWGLRSEAAARPDGIGPRLLKELVNELSPALVTIYPGSQWMKE